MCCQGKWESWLSMEWVNIGYVNRIGQCFVTVYGMMVVKGKGQCIVKVKGMMVVKGKGQY